MIWWWISWVRAYHLFGVAVADSWIGWFEERQ